MLATTTARKPVRGVYVVLLAATVGLVYRIRVGERALLRDLGDPTATTRRPGSG